VQDVTPNTFLWQARREGSDPEHCKSVKRMGPVPCPNVLALVYTVKPARLSNRNNKRITTAISLLQKLSSVSKISY